MATQVVMPEVGISQAQSAFAPIDRSGEANVSGIQTAASTFLKAKDFKDKVDEEAAVLELLGDQNAADPVLGESDSASDPTMFNSLSKIRAGVAQGVILPGTQARSLAQVAVQQAIARNPANAERIRQEAQKYFSTWNPGEGMLIDAKVEKDKSAEEKWNMEKKYHEELGAYLYEIDPSGAPWKAYAHNPEMWPAMKQRATELESVANQIKTAEQNEKVVKSGGSFDTKAQYENKTPWSTRKTAQVGTDFQGVIDSMNLGINILTDSGYVDLAALQNTTAEQRGQLLQAISALRANTAVSHREEIPAMDYKEATRGQEIMLSLYEDALNGKDLTLIQNQRDRIVTQWTNGVLAQSPEAIAMASAVRDFHLQIDSGTFYAYTADIQRNFTDAYKNMVEGARLNPQVFNSFVLNGQPQPGATNPNGMPAPSTSAYKELINAASQIMSTDTTNDKARTEKKDNAIYALALSANDPALLGVIPKDIIQLYALHQDALKGFMERNPDRADEVVAALTGAYNNYLDKAVSQTEQAVVRYDVPDYSIIVNVNDQGGISFTPNPQLASYEREAVKGAIKALGNINLGDTTRAYAKISDIPPMDVIIRSGLFDNPAFKKSDSVIKKQDEYKKQLELSKTRTTPVEQMRADATAQQSANLMDMIKNIKGVKSTTEIPAYIREYLGLDATTPVQEAMPTARTVEQQLSGLNDPTGKLPDGSVRGDRAKEMLDSGMTAEEVIAFLNGPDAAFAFTPAQ